MKKFTTVLLTLVLALGLLTLTGCDKDTSPYGKVKMEKYVTLPDYESFDVTVPKVTVSQEEVDQEIEQRIANASTETKKITKGKVEKGDKVNISFKGTLEDGTTEDGMSSDNFPMVLGEANMIDGFQEGLYGATIGKTVELNLKFPKPYEMNKKLAGKKVTFEVTVLNKEVPVKVKFDEKFIKKDSEKKASNKDEYKKFIKESLMEKKSQAMVLEEQKKIFQQIVEKTEVSELLDDQVKAVHATYLDRYKKYAKDNKTEWKDFLEKSFGWTEKEFNDELQKFAENNVKESMIIYALAQKEDTVLTDKEYEEKLEEILKNSGYPDKEAFKKSMGFSLEEYGEMYGVRINTMTENAMEKIYNRLAEKKK